MHSKMKAGATRLILSLAFLGVTAVAARATDLNLSSWVDSVKVSGDLRLRYVRTWG